MSRQQHFNLRFPSNAAPAWRLAGIARDAFIAALACLPVLPLGLAAGADAVAGTTASSTIGCSRQARAYVADRALTPDSQGAQPVSLDGGAATIPIWKAVTLGTHANAGALRKALVAAGCGIGELAGAALGQPGFRLGAAGRRVDLVVVSAADLGVDAVTVSLAEIHRRALRRGLALCPAEVAPQLRLQYPDQPVGELLHVAMAPIAAPGGAAVGFIVGNGGSGPFLVGVDARPDRFVPSTARFVFVRPPTS